MNTNPETTGHAKVYQNIKVELCGHLAYNRPSSGRLPPIRTLARNLSVGQSSLHQAIKELVDQGLLISRPKLGTFINASSEAFLKEQENTQSLLSHSSGEHPLSQKWVEILYPRYSIADRFFMEAAEALVSTMSGLGLQITRDFLERDLQDPLENRDKPDALVLINPIQPLKTENRRSQALVVISTTQYYDMGQSENFDMVCIDDIQCGLIAGKYLKSLGLTEVCFVGIQDPNTDGTYDKTSRDRLNGLVAGLGQPIRPEWHIRCRDYEIIYGAMAVGEWLKLSPRPLVIFAASDDIAFGFINGAQSHGLRPGQDYQIIGLDGQQMGKDFGVGTIATVAAPLAEMGKLAGKFLLERLSNPQLRSRRLLLGGELIEGDTIISRATIADESVF
jgi:DNA-binding LacI/PurR family transcriptional regulator/DNA-binding transcriptional regulator YhcF (GntR family)